MTPSLGAAALPATVRRVAHLAQREVEGEVVVLDLRQGRLFGLNAEGGALLDSMRESRATAPLRDADPATLEFVRTLVGLGLVAAAEEAASDSAPLPVPASPPRLLWQEEAARVIHQTSPPQMITTPQCQP